MCARQYHPKATDEDIDYLMWNATAFPFVSAKVVWQQLKQALKFVRNGWGNVIEDSLFREMEYYKRVETKEKGINESK